MASILLIEDDHRIREALARALATRGHEVRSSATGLAGVEDALAEEVDLVVLDLGLPDVDGIDVLKMIRSVSPLPIVIATARDEEAEIVKALDAGADDYVVKPFSSDQLDARIRAVLRRLGSDDDGGPVVVGQLTIDQRARSASLGDESLELSRREFDLLLFLAQRAGTVIGKREILAEVWRQPYGGADKTVDVHVSWLRRKLGESAAEPVYLHTVRGVGIKLVDPDA
ncbi:MAG: response regulator transcription factor [Acidimicrobiia bacterium]|nr:response regulator transcription factor [Acidimicrobiia bacterium]